MFIGNLVISDVGAGTWALFNKIRCTVIGLTCQLFYFFEDSLV